MGDSRPTQKTTYFQATLGAEPKDCNKKLGSYPTRIPTQKVFVAMICNDGGNLTIGASFRESPNPKVPKTKNIQKKILAKNIQFDNKAVVIQRTLKRDDNMLAIRILNYGNKSIKKSVIEVNTEVKYTSMKNIIILFRKLENLKISQIPNQLKIEISNEISLQDKNIGLTNNNLDTPENQMGVDSINQEISLSKDSGINTPEAEMQDTNTLKKTGNTRNSNQSIGGQTIISNTTKNSTHQKNTLNIKDTIIPDSLKPSGLPKIPLS
ncbi:hypothetical protein BB559_002798 [Furculomyces boomerangus]|uniref:Uncharacterized protein n=2 Tax=Harpellales TaxID=61421 RepID=A0A2T9YSD5_9FUNG|nr:hypothetical protein BB559_002798 [Furculomyces boomerangus]PWA01263.1 hypothetical protein BB558_002651 [Smittium angustum]